MSKKLFIYFYYVDIKIKSMFFISIFKSNNIILIQIVNIQYHIKYKQIRFDNNPK